MKIQVGKKYKNREGRVVKIIGRTSEPYKPNYTFEDRFSGNYTEEGFGSLGDGEYDLIEEVFEPEDQTSKFKRDDKVIVSSFSPLQGFEGIVMDQKSELSDIYFVSFDDKYKSSLIKHNRYVEDCFIGYPNVITLYGDSLELIDNTVSVKTKYKLPSTKTILNKIKKLFKKQDNTLKVKFKLSHPHAEVPKKAHPSDAGFDIKATKVSMKTNMNTGATTLTCSTGLSVAIPEGHVGLLFPRSSISKTNLTLANSVGVIDENYRGEIMFKFRTLDGNQHYREGDRIGQLIIIPYPKVEFEEVQDLDETDRGSGAFGSTGV